LDVTKEVTGDKSPARCYLTKVDAGGITLDLHLSAPDVASRDTLRSTLIWKLSQRFVEQKVGLGPETPSFA
jgi:hypothetical protein